jgi:aspartyl-tRNA synthetase
LQGKIFKTLGITAEEAEEKFGFMLKAFKFGAPPHAGIALGLDRLYTMITGSDSIREVIAFPKTQKGTCPLSGAPSSVSEKQLKELHLKLVAPQD